MKQNNETAMMMAKIALILPAVSFGAMMFSDTDRLLTELFCLATIPTSIVLAFLAKFKSSPYVRVRKLAAAAMVISLPLLFTTLFAVLLSIYGACGYSSEVISGTSAAESLAVCAFLGVAYVRGRLF